MSQRSLKVIDFFVIISFLFQASELQLVVYAYSSDDCQSLAPRSSFDQKYLPISQPDEVISRTNLNYEEFLQGLEFLDGLALKKNKSWYWSNVLHLMERAGVLSKGASEKLREGVERGEKKVLRMLRLFVVHVRMQGDYSALREIPDGLNRAIQSLDLQMEPIEGHPLMLLREENIGYRGKIMTIEELLPEGTSAARSYLSSRGGQRPTWRSQEIASPPSQMEARNDEILVSSPSVGLVLYHPGVIATQIRQGGFLERRPTSRPIHNEREWAQRFYELATGSIEDMDEAIELLRFSQMDKTLYRILKEEGLDWQIFLTPFFEYMNPEEGAKLLIRMARAEEKKEDYEDYLNWLAGLLGNMDPDQAIAIFERWLIQPDSITNASIEVAQALLTYGFQDAELGSLVYIWERLHERWPENVRSWKEYGEFPQAQRSLLKKHNRTIQALSDMKSRMLEARKTPETSYYKIRGELERALGIMAESGSRHVSERLKARLSDLVLLGQNGNTVYETVLRPLGDSEFIHELFGYQSPEVMAIFLTEVAMVGDEYDDRYMWLLKLLVSPALGEAHRDEVIQRMLFNERLRKAESHKALQRIFARGTNDPELLDRAVEWAEGVAAKGDPGVYNEAEGIAVTGVFLVRDLQGDLRREAILRAVESLKEVRGVQEEKGLLNTTKATLREIADSTVQLAAQLLKDERSGMPIEDNILRSSELPPRPSFALEDFRQAYIENVLGAIKILGEARVGVKQEGREMDASEISALDMLASLVWGHENQSIKDAARRVLEAADPDKVEEVMINQFGRIDRDNIEERNEVLKLLVPISVKSTNVSPVVMRFWGRFAPALKEWDQLSKKLTPLERKRALLLLHEWSVRNMRFQRGLADEIEKGMQDYEGLGIDASMPLFVIHDLRERQLDTEKIKNDVRTLKNHPWHEAGDLFRRAKAWFDANRHEWKEIVDVVQELSRLQKEVFGAVDVPFSLETTLGLAWAALSINNTDLIHVLAQHHQELTEVAKVLVQSPIWVFQEGRGINFSHILLSVLSLLKAGCKSEEMNLNYIVAALNASGGRSVEFHKNLKVLERLEIRMIQILRKTRKNFPETPHDDFYRRSIPEIVEHLKQYPKLFRRAVGLVIQLADKESNSVDDLYSPSAILIPLLDLLKTYLGDQEPHPSIAGLVFAIDPKRRAYAQIVSKTLHLLSEMIKRKMPLDDKFVKTTMPEIVGILKGHPSLLLKVLDLLIYIAREGIHPNQFLPSFEVLMRRMINHPEWLSETTAFIKRLVQKKVPTPLFFRYFISAAEDASLDHLEEFRQNLKCFEVMSFPALITLVMDFSDRYSSSSSSPRAPLRFQRLSVAGVLRKHPQWFREKLEQIDRMVKSKMDPSSPRYVYVGMETKAVEDTLRRIDQEVARGFEYERDNASSWKSNLATELGEDILDQPWFIEGWNVIRRYKLGSTGWLVSLEDTHIDENFSNHPDWYPETVFSEERLYEQGLDPEWTVRFTRIAVLASREDKNEFRENLLALENLVATLKGTHFNARHVINDMPVKEGSDPILFRKIIHLILRLAKISPDVWPGNGPTNPAAPPSALSYISRATTGSQEGSVLESFALKLERLVGSYEEFAQRFLKGLPVPGKLSHRAFKPVEQAA